MNFKTIGIIISIFTASINANASLTQEQTEILKEQFKRINYTGDIQNIVKLATVTPAVKKSESKAAEKTMTYNKYRKLFITPKKLNMAKKWMQKNSIKLREAELKFGVEKEIIAAILLIETKYGAYVGKHKVIDALVSRVVNNPNIGKYFIKQIPAFEKICEKENKKLDEIMGSYAGAFGITQFMPTSYTGYAVDGDSDGHIDVWTNHSDAIFSVANYFNKHKWEEGNTLLWKYYKKGNSIPKGWFHIEKNDFDIVINKNIKVIQRWNRSLMYAMVAAEIYQKLKS